MSPARALAALACATALVSGCAEFYRWPDRMNRPQQRYAQVPEGHYVIKPGDTLYSVAFRYSLDFHDLAEWNDIGGDYLIKPGQVIRLTPPPGGSSVASDSPIRTSPVRSEPPSGPSGPSGPARPASKEVPAVDMPDMPRGTWRWPTAGAVVKPYGEENAKGVDIGGALGQPVVAAASGKVVYSGAALKGYGELIIIKHDETFLSAYGYNRKRMVSEGAVVAAGQPIAELGLGPEQKPILHFEIRRRGKPVDPKQYLPPV